MSSTDAASVARIIVELGEVSRDLWNAGKLNSQARTLERICEELRALAVQQAPDAARDAGSEAPILGLTQYEPIRKTDALRALKSQPALKLAEDGKGE
jgi:hypothetical protein